MQTENLSAAVYNSLREKLVLGELRPGTALSIRGLAKEVGTSAMPVREALRQLASEEALIGAAKKAYRVPSLGASEAAELFFVRSVLEGAASELAVEHVTQADLPVLRALAKETDAAWQAGEAQRYIRVNYEFHNAINRRAGNAALLGTIESLYARTGPWLADGVAGLIRSGGVQDGHARIVEAFALGDAGTVRRLVEEDAQWAFKLYQTL